MICIRINSVLKETAKNMTISAFYSAVIAAIMASVHAAFGEGFSLTQEDVSFLVGLTIGMAKEMAKR